MYAWSGFSLARWWSIVVKEFLQLRRDRVTFGMIVSIPIIQMTLFGFAINTDPKHMPTAVIAADQSEFTRTLVASLQTSGYFVVTEQLETEEAGRAALAQGRVQFVLNIPADFTRRLLRGERPSLLLEADATDPAATGMALGAVEQVTQTMIKRDVVGALGYLAGQPAPFELRVHRLYNPENNSQYNTVPGLIGVVLTMTLVMMTGLAMTRERERGTMENLLAMPVRPLEVMSGKIVPYIAIGLLQATIILVAARLVFEVPFVGTLVQVYTACLFFITANLTVGITLSSLAQNQLQSMQMAVFYYLPNMLLSGFIFPFRGMPDWAQAIGNILPLTYFNRLIRGILLKGNAWVDMWPNLWPIALFAMLMMVVAVRFYRRTLD